MVYPVPGLPGFPATRTASHRRVIKGNICEFLPGGKIIDGSKARDSGNTGDLDILQAGLLMGKITTGGKYAPSILGVMTDAEVITATSVTVSAAQATEIVRRVGATGTLTFTGPPTAGGVVASFTETYSAVDTATGIITCSALDAALIAGSFVGHNDGSEVPRTFIPDGWGIQVTEEKRTSDIDAPFAQLPIRCTVDASQLLPAWPSDTSLQDWIRDKLNTYGRFVFDYQL